MVVVELVVHRPPSRGCPADSSLASFKAVSREGFRCPYDAPPPRSSPPACCSRVAATAEPQAQSPEEFVNQWVAVYNDFEDSGDASVFASLNAQCATCQDFITLVEEAYAKGGFVKSAGWKVESTEEFYRRPGAVGIRATVMVSPSRYKPDDAGEVTVGRGGEVVMEFDLVRRDGQWKLATVTRSAT
jgi:hypothetical protein